MALHWIDRVPERPDRYLDWDLVNRIAVGETPNGWCSVLVQLDAAPGPDPAAYVKQLRDELPRVGSTGTPTINASSDERALIDTRIAELASGALKPHGKDDPRLSFFVYMPETRAYAGGGFNHQPPTYTIRLVGPPIPDLRFDQRPAPVAMTLAGAMAESTRASPAIAVGIIDTAIAFANERFRTRSGVAAGDVDATRVKRLWLQTVEKADTDPSRTVLFGKRLAQRDIELALETSAVPSGVINEDAVYAATGAVDFTLDLRQATARRVGHGTHVMDLACGYAVEDAAGDDRPILAVQLPEPAKLRTSAVVTASYVLQGLRQIMQWADAIEPSGPLPLVVNFSYGYFAGPKDGTSPFEQEMRRLIESRKTPTALVLPAGNTYLARVTAKMTIDAGREAGVDWMVLPDCGSISFLEIWLDDRGPNSPVAIGIGVPGGGALAVAMPGNGQSKVLTDAGKPIGAIYFDADPTGNRRYRILVAVNPTRTYRRGLAAAPSGAWRLTLRNTGHRAVGAALYIQREDTPAGDEPPGRQSYFEHGNAHERDDDTGDYDHLGSASRPCPITYVGTLTAIASTPGAVVVGGAFARKDGKPHAPALYTSSGPTPARPGPDLAAIAEEDRAHPGVIAAGTRSGSYAIIQGTSIAAPQVTRRLADAGASLDTLKSQLGVGHGGTCDPRLGWAVIPMVGRPDIPPRRRT